MKTDYNKQLLDGDFEFTVNHFLGGYEDYDRDKMRDFMNLMKWGFEHQLEGEKPIKDELEYKKRVYRYYIWDRIFNHNLISILIDDREGRRRIPLNKMSVDELLKEVKESTIRTYNTYVLDKDTSNWNDKIEMNTDF